MEQLYNYRKGNPIDLLSPVVFCEKVNTPEEFDFIKAENYYGLIKN